MGPLDRRAHDLRVLALTDQPPPLPDFSAFHRRFRDDPDQNTGYLNTSLEKKPRRGSMRAATSYRQRS
jgi:hypothetical protein